MVRSLQICSLSAKRKAVNKEFYGILSLLHHFKKSTLLVKIFYVFSLLLFSCLSNDKSISALKLKQNIAAPVWGDLSFDTTIRTIHIYVALCDNKYQGIVPVPASIGNGQDPNTNLYWGCDNGIRTFFKRSKEWKLVSRTKKDKVILERLVFKHVVENAYLVADAYDGKEIRKCTEEFLAASSGGRKDSLHIGKTVIGIGGNARLMSYIGHDGLMDFDISQEYKNSDGRKRDVIILACFSKKYFAPHLKQANINPLVWTTNLMCPEAYTLHDAITGYLANEPSEKIRSRGAQAYARYQKCSEKAAKNLLVSGW
jgi:hypothetical protein